MKLYIQKENGTIKGQSLRDALGSLSDGRYYLEIEEADIRSDQQHRFLFSFVYDHAIEAFKESGTILTKDQVHWFFKYQFLRKRKKNPVTKRYVYMEGSTKKLGKKKFSQYIENIKSFLADNLNYVLPPHDLTDLTFYDLTM